MWLFMVLKEHLEMLGLRPVDICSLTMPLWLGLAETVGIGWEMMEKFGAVEYRPVLISPRAPLTWSQEKTHRL